MYFQIREVVLWPRAEGVPPRRVVFEVGVVNVITGASKTGKSAIIPIIDYCLGSDKCTIPVSTIRDACSWFGVLVDTPFGQRLFARREPGAQKSTGDMFVMSGKKVDVPNSISGPNSNVIKVKADLNEIGGLTQLAFEGGGADAAFLARPSFRDLAAFCFQPQNIVANPDVLFYKADTNEHRLKLRTIFPYVLGAVTPETLALQHEAQYLRSELKKKERELEVVRGISERWIAEIRSKVSVAREMGLLQLQVGASVPEMISALREIVAAPLEAPSVTSAGVNGASDELIGLEREEGAASTNLSHLKRRLTEMKRLQATSADYRESLTIRRDRLQISEWFKDIYASDHSCPLCGSADEAHEAEVQILYESLRRIEDSAGSFERMPAAFDREYLRIQSEIDRAAEELDGIRLRRKALENWSRDAERRRYAATAAARFIGGLEEALARYERLQSDGDLIIEIEKLRNRLRELDNILRVRNVKAATERAIREVAVNARKFLPILDVENPESDLVLAIDDLTVKVSGGNRDDYLWEIGSGANWLGYHIAITLALHNLFLDLVHSPVPSFAVFDQPSQVYFPRRLAVTDDPDLEEQGYRDEDVDAVKKIFAALGTAVGEFKGQWQAIVLDHAPEDLWKEFDDIHLVEEWRGGNKLVPLTWLE